MDPHMDPEAWRVWFLMFSVAGALFLLLAGGLCMWAVWRTAGRIRRAEWPGDVTTRLAAGLRSLL